MRRDSGLYILISSVSTVWWEYHSHRVSSAVAYRVTHKVNRTSPSLTWSPVKKSFTFQKYTFSLKIK